MLRATTVVGGDPEITGGWLPELVLLSGLVLPAESEVPPATEVELSSETDPLREIVMENAGSDAVSRPSLTLMTIFDAVPTCDMPGAPVRRPVVELNAAHEGLLRIDHFSLFPSGSCPEGRK